MEQVADKVGLRTDLMATFHENAEIVNDVLTLACTHSRPETAGAERPDGRSWRRLRPPKGAYPDDDNRLTHSISETERMNFVQVQSRRLDKDELCAVDSTTRSAYGSSLADIKWGRNKERVPLPPDFRSRRLFA